MRDLISLERVGFRRRGRQEPILRDLDLSIMEGDRILFRGPSGSGKSTLLQLLAGLVPEYVPGVVAGAVRIKFSTGSVVLQNPEAQVVTPSVEEEVAFALKNAGKPVEAIRRTVSDTIREAATICEKSCELTQDGRLVPADFRDASPLPSIRTGKPSLDAVNAEPALVVSGMGHRYGADGPDLFRDIDCAVMPGEIAALTGPSGCGKTTLLARIARILPRGPGSVCIAGTDTEALRAHERNSRLFYVPQNPEHMFVAETVRGELALSGPRAIAQAARFGLADRL